MVRVSQGVLKAFFSITERHRANKPQNIIALMITCIEVEESNVFF